MISGERTGRQEERKLKRQRLRKGGGGNLNIGKRKRRQKSIGETRNQKRKRRKFERWKKVQKTRGKDEEVGENMTSNEERKLNTHIQTTENHYSKTPT